LRTKFLAKSRKIKHLCGFEGFKSLQMCFFCACKDLNNFTIFSQFWSKKLGFRFLLRKPQNARKARGYAISQQKEKHICLVYKCVFLRGKDGQKGTFLRVRSPKSTPLRVRNPKSTPLLLCVYRLKWATKESLFNCLVAHILFDCYCKNYIFIFEKSCNFIFGKIYFSKSCICPSI